MAAALTGTAPVEDPAPTPPSRRRPRWPWRTLLAAAGGLALVLAFPGYGCYPLAVLGPAALALAVRGQRARSGAWLGFVCGLAFFVLMLSWTGVYVGPFPWLALAVYQAVFFALLGAASAVTSGLRWWPLVTAALWVTDEAVRGRWLFGGFPWGRLGLSQTDGPLLALAAYGGVPLVSFAVAVIGALLAAVVLAVRRRSRAVLAPLAAALAVPLLGGLAWLPLPGASLTDGGPTRTVAVIQGNVPRAGLDFNAQRRAVLDNHVAQTEELADAVARGDRPQPDLVVWPENSSDIDPYVNDDAARAIDRAARAIDAPILVGAVVDGPGRYLSNTGIVWDPVTGPGETYVKQHPVPLAEYVPARSFFRFFTDKVDLVRRDFRAGEGVGLLDIGGARVGDVICFEVVYDGLVHDTVDAGAGMLVVQTNNATFGHTDESEQQLAASRLRAVEYGRTVVVAATSGISAVIAPDGTVVRRSELFTPQVFVTDIAQRNSTTLAERAGSIPEWTLTGGGLGALTAVLVGGVVRRRRLRAG